MFTSDDIKTIKTEEWFHLFACYLENEWDEFKESCKEYDINDEYAFFICRLADKLLPRKKREFKD